jgi:nucleoside-diphosphate-sugar epimerase
VAVADAIAVTGAGGFIGRAFCERSVARGRALRRFVHSSPPEHSGALAIDLAEARIDDLARSLRGASTVVHLAARVHVMDDTGPDAGAAYRRANVDATARLAKAAVEARVRRFVFASTVKVNGESTARGAPFRPEDPPAPRDAYAQSKRAAEQALADIAHDGGMEAVVLRLPLVYGAGARGNFRRLVDAVREGRWLPLGAIDNRRSLLGLANLVDALDAAIDAPGRLHGVHFIADSNSVATPDLVRAIAHALQVRPRLLPVSPAVLRIVGAAAGRRDAIARLTESLEVDTSSFVAATQWRPRAFAIEPADVAAGAAYNRRRE